VTDEPKRHQFYGRRKGHALRRNHLALMRGLLPALRVDPAQLKSPAWLEIGFGGGEHLAHLAAAHPGVNFIGAEAFINGIAKLLAAIDERGLDNIRIHDGDARDLLEALPDASLERIYLLYPDPWPKERQKKRRFVNPWTLDQFARLATPGGQFFFASDIPDYIDWTLDHISAHSRWHLVSDRYQPFENWTETRYEAKAKREGRTPRYLTFQLIS
jgi:tRNA (guanine-N7-)-methyltransferase